MSPQRCQARIRPGRSIRAWSLGVSCWLWFALVAGSAAEYEQKQGDAVLQVQAERIEAGRVEMRLSDVLLVTVQIAGSETLEVQPPAAWVKSADWQVRPGAGPEKIVVAAGRVRWLQRFHLVPLRSGELLLTLAPLRFRPNPQTESWEEISWRPLPVHVITEVYHPDLSELHDIAPPEEVPRPPAWEIPWTGLAGGVVILFLLLSMWVLLRRRRRHEVALSPRQWALHELEQVSLPTALTEESIAGFYTELSDVLRKYVELAYQLPALEQTTAEFLEAARRAAQLPVEQQAILRDFLELCDLVKFARAQPTLEDCRRAAETARAFVGQGTTSL